MGFTFPESMDELCYMTRRNFEGKGKVIAWVERGTCPKCNKGLMSKPKDPKTGKFKIRSTEYVCNECGFETPKTEFEETLMAKVIYTCAKCDYEGEIETPFKRKKVGIWDEEKQKKVPTECFTFACQKCGEKIHVTKKMK